MRVGVISPEVRVAARRREVAGRLERELKEERRMDGKCAGARVGKEGQTPYDDLV